LKREFRHLIYGGAVRACDRNGENIYPRPYRLVVPEELRVDFFLSRMLIDLHKTAVVLLIKSIGCGSAESPQSFFALSSLGKNRLSITDQAAG